MSQASLGHAVIVDRDPALLARLAAELSACGFATETLASTLGLTPDLLELSAPNLVVLDAELPGIEWPAVLVITRSLKARRSARIVLSTEGPPEVMAKRVPADQVLPRQKLLVEGARALGFTPGQEPLLDVRALLDEVLGSRAGRAGQPLEVRVDLFSKSNLYRLAGDADVSGVFVASSLFLPIGQRVKVSLELLSRHRIETEGEVVWHRPHSSFGGRVATGFGIKLLSLSAAHQQVIARFLDAREPLIWGG